jgi:hypothetical protein
MLVIPKAWHPCNAWLNIILAVFVVKKMFKLFVFRFKSCVAYQTCSEFYGNRARKISALVYFYTKSYAIFNPVLAAVQTARQGIGNVIFSSI